MPLLGVSSSADTNIPVSYTAVAPTTVWNNFITKEDDADSNSVAPSADHFLAVHVESVVRRHKYADPQVPTYVIRVYPTGVSPSVTEELQKSHNLKSANAILKERFRRMYETLDGPITHMSRSLADMLLIQEMQAIENGSHDGIATFVIRDDREHAEFHWSVRAYQQWISSATGHPKEDFHQNLFSDKYREDGRELQFDKQVPGTEYTYTVTTFVHWAEPELGVGDKLFLPKYSLSLDESYTPQENSWHLKGWMSPSKATQVDRRRAQRFIAEGIAVELAKVHGTYKPPPQMLKDWSSSGLELLACGDDSKYPFVRSRNDNKTEVTVTSMNGQRPPVEVQIEWDTFDGENE